MEIAVLLLSVGVSLLAMLVGFRYKKSITYFLVGGIIAFYTLARLATDQALTLQHDFVISTLKVVVNVTGTFTTQLGSYKTYTCTVAGACSNDVILAIAALAVLVTVQFLFVIERQTEA